MSQNLSASTLAAMFENSKSDAVVVTDTLRNNYSNEGYLKDFAQCVIEMRKPHLTSTAQVGDLASALKRAVPKDEDGELLMPALTFSFKSVKGPRDVFTKKAKLIGVSVSVELAKVQPKKSELHKVLEACKVQMQVCKDSIDVLDAVLLILRNISDDCTGSDADTCNGYMDAINARITELDAARQDAEQESESAE